MIKKIRDFFYKRAKKKLAKRWDNILPFQDDQSFKDGCETCENHTGVLKRYFTKSSDDFYILVCRNCYVERSDYVYMSYHIYYEKDPNACSEE